jgi:hypothetical protein
MWPDQTQDKGYSQAMLSFGPLQNNEHLNADSHKESILKILHFYGKDYYSNVACKTGENCPTNCSVVEKALLFLVGCTSLCLNLGIKIILELCPGVTKCIHELMTDLRNLKEHAALFRHIHLGPFLCNVPLWSSMKR